MSKNNYDDIIAKQNNARKREGASRLLIVSILLALIVCALAIFLWVTIVGKSSASGQEGVSSPLPEADLNLTESTAAPVADMRNDRTVPVSFIFHIIEDGETINSIAQEHSLSPNTITSVNEISETAPAGTVLLIPNMDCELYIVSKGDTLSSIVQKFALSVNWKTLREINSLTDDNVIPGQKIFIPARYMTAVATGTQELTSFVPAQFISPIDSTYVSDTMQVDSGTLYNTLGTADVLAAMDGSVVDISYNSADSYVTLKLAHSNGYTTVYSYMDPKLRISITDRVEQGQVMGTVNKKLFFCIEKDGVPVL